MKKYYVDTNVFLRYLLEDNQKYAKKAAKYFEQAEEEKITLVVSPQIIFEIEYILYKLYKVKRRKIGDILQDLISWSYLQMKNRSLLYDSLILYKKTKIDLVDIVLFLEAKKDKASVLSFAKDFKRLKREDKTM